MGWTLSVSIALYTLGLLHSLFGFCRKRKVFVKVALAMVGGGFIFHSIALVLLGIAREHFPITNLPESLCLFAWFLSLIFLLAHIRYDIKALGAFTLPLVSLLTITAFVIHEENQSIPPDLKNGWVYFHSSIAFLAYAAFFLTFVSGILYLIQEKELKTKNFRFLYFRLPSLQVCDELMRLFLTVGFVAMSLTIISGSISAPDAWGQSWSGDPKVTASLITWGIYLVLLLYRLSARWRSRRAAYISIVGFASVLITFGINWGFHTYL
ncbi:MAG: cytochrome c biogenesis protein CcsA [Acidobacteria bacterium]|nr:cytochrome c biogenesis protein CcsA [Acidobacteriota bacterium]